ncbi:sugar phosphate isomerase/epimerase, partial [Candidatus Sumerlaeota bacterium]|nr:sugar phosphate isomerase/epimerase [Candidatus Sumerlaeota bacterium]
VFPNDIQKKAPREVTIKQIADSLNVVGPFAADNGQEVRLEAHGSAGDLPTIREIMDQVTSPAVRVMLNSAARDAAGKGFEHNFNLVKGLLGGVIHLHGLSDPEFPYQLQIDLLAKMGWQGWALLEMSEKVPDRVKAMIELRELWDKMVAKAPAA